MRMKLIWSVTFLSIAVAYPAAVNAQGDFFWTNASFESGHVANQDLNLHVPVGIPRSMYLYWSTLGPNKSQLRVGAALEMTTSTNGVIRFDYAETFEFDVVLANDPTIVIDERWRSSNMNQSTGGASGEAMDILPDYIGRLTAFTLGGPGIINEHTGPERLDLGYDSEANAFLFARVDYTPLSVGKVSIAAGPYNGHDGNIVDEESVPAIFAAIIINVMEFPMLGDVDNSGDVNAFDIEPFVEKLTTGAYQIEADTNSDNKVDLLDVQPFVEMIGG